MMNFTKVTSAKFANSPQQFGVEIVNYSSWCTADLETIVRRLVDTKVRMSFMPYSYGEIEQRTCRIAFVDSRKELKTTTLYPGRVKRTPLVHSRGAFNLGDMLCEIQLQHPEQLSNNVTESLVAAAGPVEAPFEMKSLLITTIGACIGGGGSHSLLGEMGEIILTSHDRFRGKPPRELVRVRSLEVARRKLEASVKRTRGAGWSLHASRMHYQAASRKNCPGFGSNGLSESSFDQLRAAAEDVVRKLSVERLLVVAEINRLLDGGKYAAV